MGERAHERPAGPRRLLPPDTGGTDLLNWLRCYWRRQHAPMRHILGGFRCGLCGVAGADLDAMGFDGYVGPMRVTYTREHGQLTRSSNWKD
jgi:hypothetical protein